MDKYISIFCAVGGLTFGALGAFLTACISRRSLKNKTDNLVAVMGTNALRLVLDVVFLLAAYLVCRNFELPLLVTLISVALGLTVFGMLFLKSVVKKLTEEEDDNEADGGE
ncbi:MAG: hypothetical protein PUC58_01020 [Oscillospiraceae bacterium]|nr:hypothetical protein [Oscillospiraceae bacterium]